MRVASLETIIAAKEVRPREKDRDHVVEFRALLAARDHDTGWQVDAARDSGQDREPPAWDK